MINIIDASNLERNLYLTTQLLEIGVPMVIALNMMDMVRKNGDRIDVKSSPMRWAARSSRPAPSRARAAPRSPRLP